MKIEPSANQRLEIDRSIIVCSMNGVSYNLLVQNIYYHGLIAVGLTNIAELTT